MEFDFSKEPGRVQVKQPFTNIKSIKPKVSVVTPYYNAGKYFEQTYNCLINQTFEAFEWIIVNDGSTGKKAIEVLEKFAAKDSRIQVYHQKNAGQSKAKNYGIAQANTDMIVFLDADDLVENFYLEVLYQALQKHPQAAWSYTDLVGFGAQQYVWCKTFSAGRMTFNNILVNAAAFRKSALESVGCFSEFAKHYDEDWALYLKLLGKEMHPVHIPVIGFWYRKSESGMQQTVRRNEELRKRSDDYIKKLAKNINLTIEAENYAGALPQDAIESVYGLADKVLAQLMKWKCGRNLIKLLYKVKS